MTWDLWSWLIGYLVGIIVGYKIRSNGSIFLERHPK